MTKLNPEDKLEEFCELIYHHGHKSLTDGCITCELIKKYKAQIIEALEFYYYADKMGYIIDDGQGCKIIAQTKLIQDNKKFNEKAEKCICGRLSIHYDCPIHGDVEHSIIPNLEQHNKQLESKVKELEQENRQLKEDKYQINNDLKVKLASATGTGIILRQERDNLKKKLQKVKEWHKNFWYAIRNSEEQELKKILNDLEKS